MISYARSRPPEPKSITVTPAGSSRASSRLTTSGPKPSSCIQALPTPATRICFWKSGTPRLVGSEEQVAPDVAHDVLAGHIVDRDAELHVAVEVDVDALDRRAAPLHEMVLRVASRSGPEHHRVPRPVGDAVHGRLTLALLGVAHRHA